MSGEVMQPREAHARKVADARYLPIVIAAIVAGLLALAILYVLKPPVTCRRGTLESGP